VNAARHCPLEAEIVARHQESPSIFSLTLRLTDPAAARAYRFSPGQFNMLYLYGSGEIPISIVSDPDLPERLVHTLRDVGRVSHGFSRLHPGERIGLRGPYGSGWPLEAVRGHDVMLVTGGLGCAPVVSVIDYILRRRKEYGRLFILQGVKHSDDLIWRERYDAWARQEAIQVLLAADVARESWHGLTGPITVLIEQARFDPRRTIVMMCGPERMMTACTRLLARRGLPDEAIWVSLERNMQCAIGQCGHCQFGARFVCRDGPVFSYAAVRELLAVKGF
jgi:sulfhydrogenase subunit gamma (sulfur reductase)